MSAVPALRKVREERGTPDGGKTNKLKVRPPAVDKSQSLKSPTHSTSLRAGFLAKNARNGAPSVLNQGKRAVHGVEDVGGPSGIYHQLCPPSFLYV